MAVNDDGEVAGSVSGGCVESAVVHVALEVLASGQPRQRTFGYSDDEAFAVGLTCGGSLQVFVQEIAAPSAECRAGASTDLLPADVFEELGRLLRSDVPVALATMLEHPEGGLGATMLVRHDAPPLGSLGDRDLDQVVQRNAVAHLDAGTTAVRHYGTRGEARRTEVAVFVEAFAAPPQLLIFGAVDFSAALAKVGKILGFKVTVCDARATFATWARFPMADEVLVDWPDRVLAKLGPSLGPRDAVCVLTHDAKFDLPAIVGALATKVGYIGAMGSRRTTTEREERLRQAGVDDRQLARVMAPIGLDIGARTPEETAVSICAEIVSNRAGQPPRGSLRSGSGPIHPRNE